MNAKALEQGSAFRRQGQAQKAIASIVANLPQGTHLTAPEVFAKAKDMGVDVSLSTVYRNLHQLKAHGDVTTVSGDRGLRYENAQTMPEHDHLICINCGLTIEFTDELIHGFGKTVAKRKGFQHFSSRFDILGYCSNCSSQDKGRRLDKASALLRSALTDISQAAATIEEALEFNENRKSAKSVVSIQQGINDLEQLIKDLKYALSFMD